MVEEAYKWKITLADDSVKEEDKDKFDLAWEKEEAIKKIELIGKKPMSYDFESNQFNVDGEIITPNISSELLAKRQLYFRRRNQVRTDGTKILAARTKYIFGFVIDNKQTVASVQPAIGLMPEEIAKPGETTVAEQPEPSKSFKDELIDLKGIGAKTADQICELANSKEELAKVPRDDLIEALRDDVVELLDAYLGR